jgi:hypothetical protein
MLTNAIFVDVDPEAVPVESLHMAFGGRNGSNRHVLGEPGVGER